VQRQRLAEQMTKDDSLRCRHWSRLASVWNCNTGASVEVARNHWLSPSQEIASNRLVGFTRSACASSMMLIKLMFRWPRSTPPM
jgi:hypothetical protein